MTMTDDRRALLELDEKQADGDLVREMLAYAAERIMEAEVEARPGADILRRVTPLGILHRRAHGQRHDRADPRHFHHQPAVRIRPGRIAQQLFQPAEFLAQILSGAQEGCGSTLQHQVARDQLAETACPHVVCSFRAGRLRVRARQRPGGRSVLPHHGQFRRLHGEVAQRHPRAGPDRQRDDPRHDTPDASGHTGQDPAPKGRRCAAQGVIATFSTPSRWLAKRS
jgi:hypothetical protein